MRSNAISGPLYLNTEPKSGWTSLRQCKRPDLLMSKQTISWASIGTALRSRQNLLLRPMQKMSMNYTERSPILWPSLEKADFLVWSKRSRMKTKTASRRVVIYIQAKASGQRWETNSAVMSAIGSKESATALG